jgi:cytochrome c oxidase subunit I
MYGVAAMFFFIIGGIEALLIRVQLAQPDGTLLSADALQPGLHDARHHDGLPGRHAHRRGVRQLPDPAADRRPRRRVPPLNAFSFWCFLFGGIFLNTSWFLGGGADGGWFAYAPNTGVVFSPSHGIDFWNLGLQITGIASLSAP